MGFKYLGLHQMGKLLLVIVKLLLAIKLLGIIKVIFALLI